MRAGILVSLRAPTVRQAQQGANIILMLLILAPVFGVQALPVEWKTYLAGLLIGANITRVIFLVVALFAVLDIGLLALASARFQRSRLILD